VYAANKPISYRAMRDVAAAGAMLHVEGLNENNMSQMTSRSGATLHDQQNHIIQRICAVEAIGRSPKHLQWDEGSKRKKAWVAGALVASRENGDGSRLREVSKVSSKRSGRK
jgi:phage terminase large subunit-like protein